MVEAIAKDIGFPQISLSSQLLPMIKASLDDRTHCIDRTLTKLDDFTWHQRDC